MKRLHRLSAIQIIILTYLVIAIVFSFVLHSPISLKRGVELTYIDALFTSVSAISVTGLTVVHTADTFSLFGITVIMLLIQVGGIGIMTLGTLIWILMGQNITLSQRKLIMIDQNRSDLAGLVRLMKLVFSIALLFEGAAAILFSLYFKMTGIFDSWEASIFHGLFHALSSFTNAGFDIFGDSLYSFHSDYFVQMATMFLIILGAIGFPVLVEMKEKWFGPQRNFRFSLFTKLTTATFFALLFLGGLMIWLLESNHYLAGMRWHEQLFYTLFNTVTSRSAGLATMDVSEFGVPTQFMLSILMFIGASPSSVGGGIRTTTFIIVLLALFAFARGNHEVRAFNRTIRPEDMIKSFVLFSTAIMLVCASIILLDSFEKQSIPLISVIFEVSSAFGTTGLSAGITSALSTAGKLLLILLMFIGRIGLLALFLLFRKPGRKGKIHYPYESVLIG